MAEIWTDRLLGCHIKASGAGLRRQTGTAQFHSMPFRDPNSQFKLKWTLRSRHKNRHQHGKRMEGQDRRSWPGRCKMAIVKWLQRGGTMTSTKSEKERPGRWRCRRMGRRMLADHICRQSWSFSKIWRGRDLEQSGNVCWSKLAACQEKLSKVCCSFLHLDLETNFTSCKVKTNSEL